jgi:hypothetical protein
MRQAPAPDNVAHRGQIRGGAFNTPLPILGRAPPVCGTTAFVRLKL